MAVKALVQRFFQLESASGVLLLMVAMLAFVWANSPIAFIYFQFAESSLFWINEGLMAVFFMMVGLELKRGFVSGQFSDYSDILLPAFAAFGGMLVPALIYGFINLNDPVAIHGWATPVATDIAFAVGVLSLFSHRVPSALKLFLLSLAIFDDLGAILIIALFYTQQLVHAYLLLSAVILLLLYLLNIFAVTRLIPYLLLGGVLWFCFLKSGIHPTIAGVLLAFAIPHSNPGKRSLLEEVERALHPWVAYLIMPLFALVNAGVSFAGIPLSILTSGVVLGIVFGLFIGKQIGVFGFSWFLIYFRRAKLPRHTSLLELYGTSLICGIGFTMSLFLGTLSFQGQGNIYLTEIRLGVVIGSILSGLVGAWVLRYAFASQDR